MHDLISGIGLLRAPILLTLLAIGVLLVPNQSSEVFLAIREATGSAWAFELGRAVASLLLFCLAILGCSLLLLASCPASRQSARERFSGLLEATALALPLAPLSAFALLAFDDSWVGKLHPDAMNYRTFVLALVASAVTAIGIGLLMVLGSVRAISKRGATALVRPFQALSLAAGLAVVATALAGIIWLIVDEPGRVAAAMGPISIVLVFCSIAAIVSSMLTHMYDRHQVPVLSICIFAAVLWASLGINNNHQIRTLTAGAGSLPDSREAFAAWLEGRRDLGDFEGRHYPVYIVAAEGGGLYAAKHAAATLARIQDGCPAFARHVFAISAVSGGSLGAAVFSALVNWRSTTESRDGQQSLCGLPAGNDGPHQTAVRRFFRNDLLTQLLAASLFPDMLQRLVPFRVGAFDRARALEKSFEQAWSSTMEAMGATASGNLFANDHRGLWTPTSDAPALLMNATVIRTGDRTIIAPFKLRDANVLTDIHADALNGPESVRLSTAVAISARFPIVTPPALHVAGGQSIQLVDGGYYDNAGIRTATDLITKIRLGTASTKAVADAPTSSDRKDCAAENSATIQLRTGATVRVCFKIVILTGYDIGLNVPIYGELLSPMMGLYRARLGLGRSNMNIAMRTYCGGERCGRGRFAVNPHIFAKYLRTTALPLGWYLSARSLDIIERYSGADTACPRAIGIGPGSQPAPPKLEPVGIETLFNEESACVLDEISFDLKRR